MQKNSVLRGRLIGSVSANVMAQPIIMVLSLIGSVVVARTLGPESLAVIALIAAITSTLSVFFDFGILKSLPKIMPDLSVQYGQAEAIQARRQLLKLKMVLVAVGFTGLFVMDALGLWNGRESVAYSIWFFPLIGANLLFDILVENRSQELTVAFRITELVKLQLFVSAVTPLLSILAAVISHNPYLVAFGALLPAVFEAILLYRLPSYDLDLRTSTSTQTPHLTTKQIVQHYWKYMGITYTVFWFNRLVFGLPFTMLLLAELRVTPTVLGNAAIAVSIVQRGWDVSNIPLTNLRGPLVARLHAENDVNRLMRTQLVMTALVVLISSGMALATFTLGPVVFNLFYGTQYEAAVRWGVMAAVLALAANFFSLGNLTVRQMEHYSPIILATLGTIATIAANLLIIMPRLAQDIWPAWVILTYVIGRVIFWVYTDVWADRRIFQYRGLSIKLRGLAALGGALVVSWLILKSFNHTPLITAFVGMIIGGTTFATIFRVLGGVGFEARREILTILGLHWQWLRYVI